MSDYKPEVGDITLFLDTGGLASSEMYIQLDDNRYVAYNPQNNTARLIEDDEPIALSHERKVLTMKALLEIMVKHEEDKR